MLTESSLSSGPKIGKPFQFSCVYTNIIKAIHCIRLYDTLYKGIYRAHNLPVLISCLPVVDWNVHFVSMISAEWLL